jgi:hypothetical protein
MPLKLNTPSGGSVTLTPVDTTSNVTVTIPSTAVTLAAAGANTDITSLAGLTGTVSGPTTLTGATAGMAVTNVSSINGGQLAGFRNRIINGGMRVAQRGGTALLTGGIVYSAVDRMVVFQGALAVISGQVTQVTRTARKFVGITGHSSTGVGEIYCTTRLESSSVSDMSGKQVVVSARIYQDSGVAQLFKLRLDKPTVLDNFGTTSIAAQSSTVSVSSGVETIIQWTTTLASTDADLGLQVYVTMVIAGSLTASNILVSDFQLELGSVATPFEQRPYGMELALCQRYYEERSNIGGSTGYMNLAWGAANTTSMGTFSLDFQVKKRANVSVSYSALSDLAILYNGTGSPTVATSLSLFGSNTTTVEIQVGCAAILPLFSIVSLAANNNATTAKLMFSAEL